MHPIAVVARLTVQEAIRRRVLVAAGIGGVAFLTLYGVGFHFILKDENDMNNPLTRTFMLNTFTLVGLYASNFLGVLAAVLLPVDTLAGEISSGAIQTLASKPVRRADIVLGKWLGYVAVVGAYILLLTLGVTGIVRLLAGFTAPGLHLGIPLMLFEALLLVSLSIGCSTRFSTITSGILVFGLHGLAFIGNLIEQIGTVLGNEVARNVGTVASLIMPSESLWQLAAATMQPSIMRDMQMSPFSPASVPTTAIVWWAGVYLVVTLGLALRHFRRRAL